MAELKRRGRIDRQLRPESGVHKADDAPVCSATISPEASKLTVPSACESSSWTRSGHTTADFGTALVPEPGQSTGDQSCGTGEVASPVWLIGAQVRLKERTSRRAEPAAPEMANGLEQGAASGHGDQHVLTLDLDLVDRLLDLRPQRRLAVWTSNCHPCQGQVTVVPSTTPRRAGLPDAGRCRRSPRSRRRC